MIVFPQNWKTELKPTPIKGSKFSPDLFINSLAVILECLNVRNLAYSGGIDSTILLALLTRIFGEVNTFVISCRKDHPDVIFSTMGSKVYNSRHRTIISDLQTFDPTGDDAVKHFFENLDCKVIITGDGIDELACGYYTHLDCTNETYLYRLGRLIPDHLVPLFFNSGKTKVFLPYLNSTIADIFLSLPLCRKVSRTRRKILIEEVACRLNIPDEIVKRNKYGFCDAFLEENK